MVYSDKGDTVVITEVHNIINSEYGESLNGTKDIYFTEE